MLFSNFNFQYFPQLLRVHKGDWLLSAILDMVLSWLHSGIIHSTPHKNQAMQ